MWSYLVKYKPSTAEWLVLFIKDGDECREGRYYTPDKDDAYGTGKAQCEMLNAEVDKQYAIRLKSECHNDDPEADHGKADKILLELLEHLGMKISVKEFRKVHRYYA
ncbi:MAG: hypothetical protein KGI50_07920 [Patescibacteria group bacterium]|nr:hypothetical protein [Patescibacteria group bacterium]MDE2439358.1 hypothetical protein [Patescibacteria group bacterium]